MDALRKALALGIVSAVAAGLGGCGNVTSDKIEHWKTTEQGPDKLRDALRSPKVTPELRGEALAALVDIKMLHEALDDLKTLGAGDRQAIVHAAVAPLTRTVEAADPTRGPTRRELEAKDALFLLRDDADEADRQAMDKTVIAWETRDLEHRADAGGQGGEHVLETIGPPAGPALAAVLGDDSASDKSRLVAARVLGKVGDAASRESAGKVAVERARKQHPPGDDVLMIAGLVGGPSADRYLATLATETKEPIKLRQHALLALAEKGEPESLATALRLAGDSREAGEVRDAAFQLCEKIGAPSLPGLVKLVETSTEEPVRWEAVEVALGGAHEAAIKPVLEALPTKGSYAPDDLRAFVVNKMQLVGAPALPALRDELSSKSWVARLAAVESLAVLGGPDDAARIAKLASDPTPLKGWPQPTLGTVAKARADALAQKK